MSCLRQGYSKWLLMRFAVEATEVTSKLAVDAQVEQRELANAILHLGAALECPDVLTLNGAWPTILPCSTACATGC